MGHPVIGNNDESSQVEPDSRCIRVIEVSDLKPTGKPRHRLPVFIGAQTAVGRILVRSAKTLIFNRVAKTGSQVCTLICPNKRGQRLRERGFYSRSR